MWEIVQTNTPDGAVVWGGDERIDACPDALYMRLTGKTPEELMPAAIESPVALRP